MLYFLILPVILYLYVYKVFNQVDCLNGNILLIFKNLIPSLDRFM